MGSKQMRTGGKRGFLSVLELEIKITNSFEVKRVHHTKGRCSCKGIYERCFHPIALWSTMNTDVELILSCCRDPHMCFMCCMICVCAPCFMINTCTNGLTRDKNICMKIRYARWCKGI